MGCLGYLRVPTANRGLSARARLGLGTVSCLVPDQMVQSRYSSGAQGDPQGSETGSNQTAVPFYCSYNFGSS